VSFVTGKNPHGDERGAENAIEGQKKRLGLRFQSTSKYD
jgi:hypothetical protein